MLVPSTPMKEVIFSTEGSFKIAAASSCCLAAMASKEIDCRASEIAWISPVS
jgi:hypothetical protein